MATSSMLSYISTPSPYYECVPPTFVCCSDDSEATPVECVLVNALDDNAHPIFAVPVA